MIEPTPDPHFGTVWRCSACGTCYSREENAQEPCVGCEAIEREQAQEGGANET